MKNEVVNGKIPTRRELYEEIEQLKAENKELTEKLARSVELPFVAMLNRQIDDNGKFDKSNAEQSKNGRYCVVYLDKTSWKIPLIDVCSRQLYGREFAEARLSEIKAEDEKALEEEV